jgi:tRNA (mo5U34)-methyltransferase
MTAREQLERRVQAFPFWYHRIDLGDGVVTPGWAPIDAATYRIPEDMTGMRVLDVGAWDGYWSFEALRRGAREVFAIDDFSDYMGALDERDRKAWQTFDLCRAALGYDEARCQRREMSVYDLKADDVGRFDVVFFFGTLYHLRHPLLALDRLSDVGDDQIFVESAILDDHSPYRGGIGHGYDGGQMVMEFYPGAQYGENVSNWWVPTLHCMMHMVGAAGFVHAPRGWKLERKATALSRCRGFVTARKREP